MQSRLERGSVKKTFCRAAGRPFSLRRLVSGGPAGERASSSFSEAASSSAPVRLIANADGAVTWYPEQTGVVPTLSSGQYRARLFSAPNQVAATAVDVRGVAGTPNIRFSAIRGRSAQALT